MFSFTYKKSVPPIDQKQKALNKLRTFYLIKSIELDVFNYNVTITVPNMRNIHWELGVHRC